MNFPNSCQSGVQPAFLRGLALLHSFQYVAAEASFTEVTKAAPECAMGYWGLAMAAYHALWEGANSKAIAQGRSYLAQARKAGPVSKREQAYLDAMGVLVADNHATEDQRLSDYSHALAALSQQYPDDGEAAAFYALSLLALPDRGEDTKIRKEAIAILNRLAAAQPEHPGAVHYLIHAADTPELAPLGLEAARRYAKLAPDSSHALHMPAHIFVHLGLWQESIDSNLAAAVAAEEATKQNLGEAHYQFHAMDFLDYSYLQRGEESKARQIIADLGKVPGSDPRQTSNIRLNLTTRNLLELHRWQEALALVPEGGAFYQQVIYALHAIAAAHIGDAKLAEQNLQNMKKALRSAKKDDRLENYRLQEAEAWVDFAKGKQEKAIKRMRAAADRQDNEAQGGFNVPAREMLADMLLELHRPSAAMAEYEAVLKVIPNRFNAEYGAAVSAAMAGESGKAQTYYAQLHESCAPDADREELLRSSAATAGGK